MDYSEALKRIYRYLDNLDEIAEDMESQSIKNIADGIRGYVDEIAESVNHENIRSGED